MTNVLLLTVMLVVLMEFVVTLRVTGDDAAVVAASLRGGVGSFVWTMLVMLGVTSEKIG